MKNEDGQKYETIMFSDLTTKAKETKPGKANLPPPLKPNGVHSTTWVNVMGLQSTPTISER